MLRLVDRQRQIPGGFRYYQPQTKWAAPLWASFDTIVRSLISHRQGNPSVGAQVGWATDYNNVALEVEAFNANLCRANGWTDYYVSDGGQTGPLPFPQRGSSSLLRSGKAVAAGVATIADMFGPEGPTNRTQAEARASVCANCPKNDRKGSWLELFTAPAQRMILTLLSVTKDLDLTTPYDKDLEFCTACDCPLKGKVWARTSHVLAHLPAGVYPDLDPRCWILKEKANAAAKAS